MKILHSLPPGDWRVILWRGDLIFACPQHPPRILDVKNGMIHELKPDSVSVISDFPEEVIKIDGAIEAPGSDLTQ